MYDTPKVQNDFDRKFLENKEYQENLKIDEETEQLCCCTIKTLGHHIVECIGCCYVALLCGAACNSGC